MEELSEFQLEFQTSIDKLVASLVAVRGEFRDPKRLELCSHFLDRAGHTAKRLAIDLPNFFVSAQIMLLFVDLCKLLIFQTAQVEDNEIVFTVGVNLLCEAGRKLQEMSEHLNPARQLDPHDFLTTTFVEKLMWLVNHLPKDKRFPITIEQILESLGV